VSRIYYEIQMTARQLTVLLVLLVLALIGAFLLGYGAGVSAGGAGASAGGGPPALAEAVITPEPEVTASVVEEVPPTAAPAPRATATATPSPAPARAPATPRPEATATPKPRPTATPKAVPAPMVPKREGFWVQVLAATHPEAIEKARKNLVKLDFPESHQWVVPTPTAEGGVLHKLRIGPFPDRASAERVAVRMRNSGFPDAWVVVP